MGGNHSTDVGRVAWKRRHCKHPTTNAVLHGKPFGPQLKFFINTRLQADSEDDVQVDVCNQPAINKIIQSAKCKREQGEGRPLQRIFATLSSCERFVTVPAEYLS